MIAAFSLFFLPPKGEGDGREERKKPSRIHFGRKEEAKSEKEKLFLQDLPGADLHLRLSGKKLKWKRKSH